MIVNHFAHFLGIDQTIHPYLDEQSGTTQKPGHLAIAVDIKPSRHRHLIWSPQPPTAVGLAPSIQAMNEKRDNQAPKN